MNHTSQLFESVYNESSTAKTSVLLSCKGNIFFILMYEVLRDPEIQEVVESHDCKMWQVGKNSLFLTQKDKDIFADKSVTITASTDGFTFKFRGVDVPSTFERDVKFGTSRSLIYAIEYCCLIINGDFLKGQKSDYYDDIKQTLGL